MVIQRMMKDCTVTAPAGSHTGCHNWSHSANRAGRENMQVIRLEVTWDSGRVIDAVFCSAVAHTATGLGVMDLDSGCMAGKDSAASAQAPAETCASTTWRRWRSQSQ